jgi:hypothetical protein
MSTKLSTFVRASLLASQVIWAGPAQATTASAASCDQLTSRKELYNNNVYIKYNIVDPATLSCPQVQVNKPKMPWKVKKTSWSSQDEAEYAAFIKKLGSSKCNTVDKCLSGADNLLRAEEDLLFTHYSDCADFPYYLRSYFAYKKNLPFAMVSGIRQAPYTPKQLQDIQTDRQRILNEKGQAELDKYDARLADLRYSRNGNIPVAKITVPSANNAIERDFAQFGPRIMDIISSGTLRMLNGEQGSVESDFYSPQMAKGSIKTGTLLYNVAGHVAIVYDITADGRVLYFDAHPDNSVTRGSFNPDFKLVRSAYGGNFKNFRPIEVQNPQYDNEGNIIRGQLVTLSDSELSDFSLEQYVGTVKDSPTPIFKLNVMDSKGVDFYEWVKFRLSGGKFKLDPLNELKNEVLQLCEMSQDRIAAVQAAVDNQIHLKPHPVSLPQNIFGADGEWEAYSTPGRDLRLKQKILGIPELANEWMKRYLHRDPLFSYSGGNLKEDLIGIYRQQVEQCQITYQNSQGQKRTVGLKNIISRMARLSFDPYDCPELRWGADNQAEVSTCTNDQEKMEWYALQQFLRNSLEKDPSAVHGWTIEDLARMNERKQVDNANPKERYNIEKKLGDL